MLSPFTVSLDDIAGFGIQVDACDLDGSIMGMTASKSYNLYSYLGEEKCWKSGLIDRLGYHGWDRCWLCLGHSEQSCSKHRIESAHFLHVNLHQIQAAWCGSGAKAGGLLVVRGRWVKLCEGGDDGLSFVKVVMMVLLPLSTSGMIHAEPDGIHESLKGASLQNVTEITNPRGESPGHDIMSHGLLANGAKAGGLLVVRGRWVKLCEGGDDGLSFVKVVMISCKLASA
ncbi:hypothetical protein Bca101_005800 [Brassica carinata]